MGTGWEEIVWIALAFLCLVFGYLAGRADERRRMVAIGGALDRLAALVNVKRIGGESDTRLRERIRRPMDVQRMDLARERERFIGESPSAYEARLRREGLR